MNQRSAVSVFWPARMQQVFQNVRRLATAVAHDAAQHIHELDVLVVEVTKYTYGACCLPPSKYHLR